MKILAIESSCDETAAAVVVNGTKILSSAVASSTLMHAKYGGIVPEVAAREQLKCILSTITEALDQAQMKLTDIDSLAVTVGPGLIGSLLVGVETAKTIAFVSGKPIIPVNHVLAHMYANFVHSDGQNSSREESRDNIVFPVISLVVSGGHTELFLLKNEKDIAWLGGTLDDAAGEAFDKSARLLGFENRGGPAIQEAASGYHVSGGKYQGTLPRPMMHDGTLNFSFSGLKTAILREVNKLKEAGSLDASRINHFAYEVQEAITDVLVAKTLHAAEMHNAQGIWISGGVAANAKLREKLKKTIEEKRPGTQLRIPPISLCTDNAVYIAAYAYFRGSPIDWHDITAIPDLSVEEI